jgi:hypothetical protein
MIPAGRQIVKAGIVAAMKKLLVLALLAVASLVLARRRAAARMHGTPDHWPSVPRKSNLDAPSTPA